MNKYHKRIIEKKYGTIQSCKLVSKWRKVYQLKFEGYSLRLDILKKGDKTLEHQKVCLAEGIDCFPTIKHVFDSAQNHLKLSEWIVGKTYSELAVSDTLSQDMLFQMGSYVGRVNNIKNGDLILHNDDITYHNVMLDVNDSFIMFDLDRLSLFKDVDGLVMKTLLKRIVDKKMIDSFLEGYKRHRDINNIVSLCEQRNWVWKRKKRT